MNNIYLVVEHKVDLNRIFYFKLSKDWLVTILLYLIIVK